MNLIFRPTLWLAASVVLIGCKTSGLRSANLASNEAFDSVNPPKIFFHVGKRANLETNISAHEISQDVWDKYIIGGPRFPLPMWRRGYYGSAHPHIPMYYGNDLIQAGQAPWMEMAQVKPSCLTPEVTFDQRKEFPDPNSLFHKYFAESWNSYFPTLDAATKACIDMHDPAAVTFNADTMKRDIDVPDTHCESILQDFLTKKGPGNAGYKVVFDAREDDSWYLRDRECLVGTISGTDDDVLAMLKDPDIFWGSLNLLPAEQGAGPFESIVFQALAGAQGLTIEDVNLIAGYFEKTTPIDDPNHPSFAAVWKDTRLELARGLKVFKRHGKSGFQRYMRFVANGYIGTYFVRTLKNT